MFKRKKQSKKEEEEKEEKEVATCTKCNVIQMTGIYGNKEKAFTKRR